MLGDELAGLHPRLRAYFSAIPAGHHGFGWGVFDSVGTPRRWLWPALAVFARAHVIFPVWERAVPFTVVNRPTVDASGREAVIAVRTFLLRSGTRRMVDEIAVANRRQGDGPGEGHDEGAGAALVDRLGSPALLETALEATVDSGALSLRSTMVTFRVGRRRIPLPRSIAPRVVLTESFDDDADAQRVEIAVVAPLIGTIYEYAGMFQYEIRPGEPSVVDEPSGRESGE